MYKNLLCGYKGGGYDGCWWEWNFFFFNELGEFHSLLATGYAGIKTEELAILKIEEIQTSEKERRGDYEVLINLEDGDDVLRLRDLFAWDLVRHVLMRLAEHYEDNPNVYYNLVCPCDECGVKIHASDFECGMYGVDICSSSGRCSGPFYYGTVVCEECFTKGECCVCRDRSSSADESYWGADQLDEYGFCEHHSHYRLLELYWDNNLARIPETEDLLDALRIIKVYPGDFYLSGSHNLDNLLRETWKECVENEADPTKKPENPNQMLLPIT